MRVQFWGTRGSIATPGPTTLQYGGNTSCVQVTSQAGTHLVLDCGTGARPLGQALVGAGVARGHLLISHTHWDHIQGLPFFLPLFLPGNEWDIYAPGAGRSLEATLAGQMEYTYFPVTMEQLASKIAYHDLSESRFDVGDVQVTTHFLNHPAVSLGYRLAAGGVTVVYSSDHEPHSPHQATPTDPPQPGQKPNIVHAEDKRHVEFLSGADLVIHDAQYTAAEYPKKTGWGHSTVEYVVDVAVAAGVKRLALYHHDPTRDDSSVTQLLDACRERAQAWGSTLEIVAAAEGLTVDFPEAVGDGAASLGSVRAAPTRVDTARVLIVDDEPDLLALAALSLKDEGYEIVSARNGRSALELIRTDPPDLILLDWSLPELDGVAVSKEIRHSDDPRIRSIPIIMLTGRAEAADTQAGLAAGADDYLIKPFTPAHLRTRVRQWLQRGLASSTPL